jgi:two-component system, response regulator, stage 0 sporulation protein F
MSVSILAVDDEMDVADMFRQSFRREVRQGQYVLHFARSAEEALDKLARGIEPELIAMLSDINMPGGARSRAMIDVRRRRQHPPVPRPARRSRRCAGGRHVAFWE